MAIGCVYCKGGCQKAGRQSNGTQKCQCKDCRKYQQAVYPKKGWLVGMDAAVIAHVKEGCRVWNKNRGIRWFPRLLKIAQGTVIARIKRIAKVIKPPE